MPGILKSFKSKIGKLTNRDIINSEYKPLFVDEQVVIKTKAYSIRHRCSQRLGKGLFFTDNEKKNKINKINKLALP